MELSYRPALACRPASVLGCWFDSWQGHLFFLTLEPAGTAAAWGTAEAVVYGFERVRFSPASLFEEGSEGRRILVRRGCLESSWAGSAGPQSSILWPSAAGTSGAAAHSRRACRALDSGLAFDSPQD